MAPALRTVASGTLRFNFLATKRIPILAIIGTIILRRLTKAGASGLPWLTIIKAS